MKTPENNEKSGKVAYDQPVPGSWPVVRKSPDGTPELAWYKSKFPDDDSIIGWFDDSIEPVKAREYLQMITDVSREDSKVTVQDPASEHYDVIYNRPALIF
jgi:hypothetical protein